MNDTFTLKITTGNDDCLRPADVGRHIARIGRHLQTGGTLQERGHITDTNGNKIGEWTQSEAALNAQRAWDEATDEDLEAILEMME